MESIFLYLFNMSITAASIALIIFVLRLLLKKAPKWIMGILWGIVALRLICPFSFESNFSLIPDTEFVPQEILLAETPSINSSLDFIGQSINPTLSATLSPQAADSITPMQSIAFIASIVWIIGIIVMLSYALISYLRIQRKVNESIKTNKGYWICDHISTPFIFGIFHPRIYLPSAMSEPDCSYVLSHEKAHLQRKDYLWKPLGFLLLSFYWFNPVLWIAYILLCRDIELACDEKVLKQMGVEIKKPYSEALINCSVPRHMITACPLAFGEVGVKERVKSVLNYKKPAFWIIIIAVLACIIAAVSLLTIRPKDTSKSDITSDQNALQDTDNKQHSLSSDQTSLDNKDNTQPGDSSNQASIQYKVSSLIFNNTTFSFTETADNAPQYYIFNGTLMWNFQNEGEEFKSSWNEIGPIKITKINKSDFEAMLINGEWYDTDFFDFYKSIVSIEKAETEYLGVKQFFLVLRLDDSSVALCRGFYSDSNAPFIRWIQTLEQISISTTGGADSPDTATTKKGFNSYFNASVLEINDDTILVEPYTDTTERNCSDKIYITSNVISTNPVPELEVGSKIRVVYNGEIEESYPAQINTVFAIYSLDNNGDIIYIDPAKDTVRYCFYDSVDPINPTIVLSHTNNTFQFTYSALSSYFAYGSYELTDDKLILKTNDGENTYTFTVNGSNFVFDAAESSSIPKFSYSSGAAAECPVPDGAVFK